VHDLTKWSAVDFNEIKVKIELFPLQQLCALKNALALQGCVRL